MVKNECTHILDHLVDHFLTTCHHQRSAPCPGAHNCMVVVLTTWISMAKACRSINWELVRNKQHFRLHPSPTESTSDVRESVRSTEVERKGQKRTKHHKPSHTQQRPNNSTASCTNIQRNPNWTKGWRRSVMAGHTETQTCWVQKSPHQSPCLTGTSGTFPAAKQCPWHI